MAPGTPHTKMSKKELAANKKARKQLQEAAKRKERTGSEQMEGENGTQNLPEKEPPHLTVEGNDIPNSTNGVATRSVRVNIERPVPNEIGVGQGTTDNGDPARNGVPDIGASVAAMSSVSLAEPGAEAADIHLDPVDSSTEQLDSDGETQGLNAGFTQESLPRPREGLVGAYMGRLPPRRSKDPVQNKNTLAKLKASQKTMV